MNKQYTISKSKENVPTNEKSSSLFGNCFRNLLYSAFNVGNDGVLVLHAAENQMRFGELYAVKGADGTVDFFQTVGGIGDDLQNVVEIAGDRITRNDAGHFHDHVDEIITVLRMHQRNLHNGRYAVSDLLLVDDDGILTDKTRLFHPLNALGDSRDGQFNRVADGRSLRTGVFLEVL